MTFCLLPPDNAARRTSLRLKNPNAASSAADKSTNKRGHKRQTGKITYKNADGCAGLQTLEEWRDLIRFSGFDKPYNSTKETFLVTNNGPEFLGKIEIRLTYSDLEGRMLHSRTMTLNADVPPGQTRQLTVKSFDTQKSYFYHKSKSPRTGGQSFTVSIELLHFHVER